tara:strand:+ start:505 stop:642 length:138 start_codon:yes stop_codon:yes gene_type:complete
MEKFLSIGIIAGYKQIKVNKGKKDKTMKTKKKFKYKTIKFSALLN